MKAAYADIGGAPWQEIRVAHRFRPMYAEANMGHPSDFLQPWLWSRKGIGGRLLECLAEIAGITVDARALHHENVSEPAHWVYPRLRAPRPSMTEGAGR
jgi:hypothetical protein